MQPNDGIIAVWDRSGATRTLRAAQLSGFTFTPTYTVTRLDRNSAMIGAAGGRVLLVMDEFANVPPRVLVSANTSAALTQATVKGSVQVGKTVRCASGFGVEATSRSYRWKRDGNTIRGAKSGAYTLQTADRGHQLSCRSIGVNTVGATGLLSPARSIG